MAVDQVLSSVAQDKQNVEDLLLGDEGGREGGRKEGRKIHVDEGGRERRKREGEVGRGAGIILQWNRSKAAAVGEWYFGHYTEVAVVEGFRVFRFLVHEKFINCCLYRGILCICIFKYACKPQPLTECTQCA